MKSKSYAVRIPGEWAAELEKHCEKMGISPGEFIRREIQMTLGLPEPERKKWRPKEKEK